MSDEKTCKNCKWLNTPKSRCAKQDISVHDDDYCPDWEER